ncbi:FAD-binding domain-containing protein, partial [Pleomassaria siparia CBS 279.74]
MQHLGISTSHSSPHLIFICQWPCILSLKMLRLCLFPLLLLPCTLAVNFAWENIQLDPSESLIYPAIRFADPSPSRPTPPCKTIPGDLDWPSEEEWVRFNDTLGGVLLKPRPLAAVCYAGSAYDGEKCDEVTRGWGSTKLQYFRRPNIDHVPMGVGKRLCTHIRPKLDLHTRWLAVNFARNMKIRLVVKTSGHDPNGKSIGGYSLSIWTYSLRSLTYFPTYTSISPSYSGQAVALGAGIRAADGSVAMSQYNFTMSIAGGSTVGLSGGYMQGGGHSIYTSYFGLIADHVLSIQAVLANGDFVTLDGETGKDLFWAFRGGGGGTFGVITSMVVKVFPRTSIASSSITFSTLPSRDSITGLSVETFWAGVKAYFGYCIAICDAGGIGYNFIRHATSGNNTGLTFTTSISLPNYTRQESQSFTRPLLVSLSNLGIPVTVPPAQRLANHDTQ